MNLDIITLTSKPGIKRDGTGLDNDYFADGQWVRWQRGRARKMGGYRAMSQVVTGPIRHSQVDARNPVNTIHCFSPWGVQQLAFDNSGSGAGVIDRTPAGLAFNANYNWQSDVMYSGAGGGTPALVCASAPDLDNISSDVKGGVYTGDITGSAALTQISDGSGVILISGGCCVLQPFLFLYGSNGLIRNSNANDFSVATGWSGTFANSANVAGSKIVKGMAVRGGSVAPAGLFWALDALIRVSFIGGTAIWQYDTVSDQISVLSKAAIIEYDGIFMWPGIDRFYAYNGVVNDFPNDMNSNYFFDNLNYAQAQKVWALKVPRFGEIWWFFPSGNSTECDTAIIFNVKLGTWYDTKLSRTSGVPPQVFRFPIMTGGEPQATVLLTYTVVSGTFVAGNIVTGGTSGATGLVARVNTGTLNLASVTGTFVNGETISNAGSSATGTLTAVPGAQELDTVWQHEYGYDRVVGANIAAIDSYFVTNSFQVNDGGPITDKTVGQDVNTRMIKLEPDFISTGQMTVTIQGQKYANSPLLSGPAYPFNNTTEVVDMREQRREMQIKIESNVAGGYFEQGKNIAHIEPGDERP